MAKEKKVRYSYSDKYFNDYDQIRPFLRFISYGCFHKGDYKRLVGLSSSFYDMELKFARYALPADKILFYQNHHQRVHMLRGDSYHTCNNFLAASYGMKKLSPRVMFFLCGLLQLLGKYKNIDVKTLPIEFSAIELPSPDYKDEIVYWDYDVKDFKEALKLLVSEGYICKIGKTRNVRYSLSPSVWQNLTENEAEELYYAIGVYRNMTLLGMPGYNLSMKLSGKFHPLPNKEIPCQFKNVAFGRIIDDDVIAELLLAIEGKKVADFCYTNSIYPRKNGKITNRKNILPLRMVTDFCGGARQYVLTGKVKGLGNSQEPFRIEAISNLKVKKMPESELKLQAVNEGNFVRVCFHVQLDLQDKIENRIFDFEPTAKCLERNEESLVYEFYGHDKLRIIPFVRRFFPYAEILPFGDNKYLRERVGDDIKEALNNYGII